MSEANGTLGTIMKAEPTLKGSNMLLTFSERNSDIDHS